MAGDFVDHLTKSSGQVAALAGVSFPLRKVQRIAGPSRKEYLMARTKTWKHTERHVAKALNGQRVGNRGTNTEDVSHDWLSIECKHRESLPSWLKLAMWQAKTNACADKLPVVVLHESGQRHADNLVIIRMADFQEWFGGNADSEAGQLYAEGCAP